jgi:pyruvate/2-oxoacid:ferredoxin oxidoreductase alpha subunit
LEKEKKEKKEGEKINLLGEKTFQPFPTSRLTASSRRRLARHA